MRTLYRLLFLVVGVACWPAGAADLNPGEIKEARKLYVAKCAKCHRFYEPQDYSEGDWRRWMEAMSRKSKLKPDQEELLRRYLDEYRAGRIAKVK